MKISPEKSHLNPIRVPSPIDIAWSAGIWEGEGSCRNQRERAVSVTVVQKDPEILYRLRDWFGGNVRFAHCKTVAPDRQVYQWEICGDRARLFMAEIYSFLSARRKAQVDSTKCLDFLGDTQLQQGVSLQMLKEILLSYYEEHWSKASPNHRTRIKKQIRAFRERHGLSVVEIGKEQVI